MPEESSVSEEWLAAQCYRISARAGSVPILKRKVFIKEQIDGLGVSEVLRLALQNMMSVMENAVNERIGVWEKIAAFSFGVTFIVVLLALAVAIPHPTASQFFVFRVVLALAASGFAGALTGFIHIELGDVSTPWLQAGGGLAVFAIVYLINPAKYIIQ
ncbi:MAG: hypothetical protein M3O31_15720 [Acidobacteriota bacterium]|nr:hypothetical protein [Acidobacteriota bacterium]